MAFLELSNTGALEYCNAIFLCVCELFILFMFLCCQCDWDIQVFHGIFRSVPLRKGSWNSHMLPCLINCVTFVYSFGEYCQGIVCVAVGMWDLIFCLFVVVIVVGVVIAFISLKLEIVC